MTKSPEERISVLEEQRINDIARLAALEASLATRLEAVHEDVRILTDRSIRQTGFIAGVSSIIVLLWAVLLFSVNFLWRNVVPGG